MQGAIGSGESTAVKRQHLFLKFRIYRGGKVDIFPSFHYISRQPFKNGVWTPYVIELRNKDDETLYSQRILLTDPHKNLDCARLDFFKAIPFSEDADLLLFFCTGKGECWQKELLRIKIPKDSPRVKFLAPRNPDKCEPLGILSGEVLVAWEAEDYGKPLRFLLRYSNDDGRSWQTITPSIDKTDQIVNLDLLPSGEKCRFQVLASEGIRTGSAVTAPFVIKKEPIEVIIANPLQKTTFMRGDKSSLIGVAYSPDIGSFSASELKWESDIDGSLGVGRELNIDRLNPGLHRIALKAPDYADKESITSIQVEICTPTPIKHTSLTHHGHTSKDHDSGKVSTDPKGGANNGI